MDTDYIIGELMKLAATAETVLLAYASLEAKKVILTSLLATVAMDVLTTPADETPRLPALIQSGMDKVLNKIEGSIPKWLYSFMKSLRDSVDTVIEAFYIVQAGKFSLDAIKKSVNFLLDKLVVNTKDLPSTTRYCKILPVNTEPYNFTVGSNHKVVAS